MGENTITHTMKVSVAATSLKESEKKVYKSFCKKTVRKLRKAKIVSSEHIVNSSQCHRPQRYKFP